MAVGLSALEEFTEESRSPSAKIPLLLLLLFA